MDEIEGGAMDCLKIFQNKNVGRSENTNELVEPFARMLSVLVSAFQKSLNFFPSSFFFKWKLWFVNVFLDVYAIYCLV